MKSKSFVLAAMALVVILAAGAVPAFAQGEIIYLRPGERPDYVGAVDGWTGSWAQFALEDTRSYITGPLRDMQRHWRAADGYADPYYGTGVSPVRRPGSYYGSSYAYNGYGPECFGGPECGPYMWGRRYNWNDARYTYGGRYGNRGRRDGYSRPATQADVRGWGIGNAALTLGTTIVSEVRADKRHKKELEALRSIREEQREQSVGFADMADAIDRRYQPRQRGERTERASRRDEYTVINSTGEEVCVNGQKLAVSGSAARTTVPTEDFEVSPPAGKTICPVEATFVSSTTIQLTCR